jgi:hypothetical protein
MDETLHDSLGFARAQKAFRANIKVLSQGRDGNITVSMGSGD